MTKRILDKFSKKEKNTWKKDQNKWIICFYQDNSRTKKLITTYISDFEIKTTNNNNIISGKTENNDKGNKFGFFLYLF